MQALAHDLPVAVMPMHRMLDQRMVGQSLERAGAGRLVSKRSSVEELLPVFAGLATLELAVPWWAERTAPTTWHPHHIAERYGLFTIILFGESVLAASNGVSKALEASDISGPLIVIAGFGLILLFALWWLYFLIPAGDGLSDRRDGSYLWGYGHYLVFASLAALGAGLEVAVEQVGHDLAASPPAICYAVAIPTAVFIVLLWLTHAPILAQPVIRPASALCCVTAILLLPLAAARTSVAAVVMAISAVCVLLVVVTLSATSPRTMRDAAADSPKPTASL
jgi:low temperature requirement protein LtrA